MNDNFDVGEGAIVEAVHDVVGAARIFPSGNVHLVPDMMAVPIISGEVGVMIAGGGFRPGPYHRSSGTAWDLLFEVDIGIIMRTASIPKDRVGKSVWLTNFKGINKWMTQVLILLDMNYTLVLERANANLLRDTGSEEGFREPLTFAGAGKPTPVGPEMFAAAGQTSGGQRSTQGVMRVVTFGGARRLFTRG